jgi:hypothetical protein
LASSTSNNSRSRSGGCSKKPPTKAKITRDNRALVVFDAKNKSAFAGVLAALLPQPALNWPIAAAVTRALSHAAQPTPMPIAIGGLKSAVRRWTLSKRELVGTIAAELGNNTLRARAGDWEVLKEELSERLGVLFGAAGQARRPRDGACLPPSRTPRQRISSAAWT